MVARMVALVILVLICLRISNAALNLNISSNGSQFVATDDWQEILEGQSIPQGLHVRINLQTGKKEAKLLSDDEEGDSASSRDSSISTIPGEEIQHHDALGPSLSDTRKRLEAALKGIPGDDFKFDEEQLKKINTKYKSYDQIKKDLKEAHLEVTSDSDIMNRLFERFEELYKLSSLTEEDVLDELALMFEDMQYLAHQIDNALNFIDRQGVEKIIWPSLNRTETTVKVMGLRLLGTVVQNNPKAKVAVFERNGGGILLATLSKSITSDEVSAALYALGNLMRKFPYAQSELLNAQGYSLLFSVFEQNIDLRVKAKMITLISDLAQDYANALASGPDIDLITKERYESTLLLEGLRKAKFCERSADFFQLNKAGFLQDENLTEQIVTALSSMRSNLCHETWSNCPLLRHTLLVLRNNLDTRLAECAGDENRSEYLRESQQSIDRFLTELYRKDEL
ncbi:nucleotide exchange factor Sil1 [Uranotaenia lowii]|uniref:nucleotide exchange factor Sil1 n=1 Tax=Uranotaenia lowii TaxID=190385 RepID=UPI00247A77F3|nr:nucleotide exchange factor Sil1 [Uranotaenia lowii]